MGNKIRTNENLIYKHCFQNQATINVYLKWLTEYALYICTNKTKKGTNHKGRKLTQNFNDKVVTL